MASNIEIKARLGDRVCAVHTLANAMSDTKPVLIEQEDTFFDVTRGRLKLREFTGRCGTSGDGTGVTGDAAELIFYERPDSREPTASTYSLVPVPDPGALKDALAAAIGIRGVVRKRRTLYRAGGTRIHIDEVEGLGSFLELEVVLSDDGRDGDGVERCRGLMHALGIRDDDLIDRAYIDLLEEARG